MKLSRDLLADVRRLANEKIPKITDKELFGSHAFFNYAQALINSMTKRYTNPVTLHIVADETPNAMIGYTTGDKIHLNVANPLSQRYDNILSRFLTVMGIVFHEVGHILFCDFNEYKRARKTISEGRFYGQTPQTFSKEEETALAEMKDALANDAFSPIFVSLYDQIANVLDDAHDEARMMQTFGSFITQAINMTAESLRYNMESLEVQEAKLANDAANAPRRHLSIMFNCILQMARYGSVLMTEETAKTSEHMKRLYDFTPDIAVAKTTDDIKERYSYINRIVLCLWPYIKDVLGNTKDEQNGSGDGQNSNASGNGGNQQSQPPGGNQGDPSSGNNSPGNSSPSQQQIQAVLDALADGAKKSGTGQTPAPTNRRTAPSAKKGSSGPEKPPDPAQNHQSQDTPSSSSGSGDPASQAAQAALNGIMNELAMDWAEGQVENQLKQNLKAGISTIDRNSTHKGIPVDVSRPLDVTDADKSIYHSVMEEVKSYSRRLQREMQNALRDLKNGYVVHHRLMGSKLEAGQTYRLDQRFYANRKLPQDLPDMAVAVLVDQSGSMNISDRIGAAQKAAILLHDFCMGLDIPVHVAGHSTRGNHVEYEVYTDYNAVGKKDMYRLSKMHAGGCNRDGLAVEIAAGLLAVRPEEVKLLIVISDGRPNHTNYGGPSAIADIAGIVRKYQRKGVEILGAAIGDDKDIIKSIYKESFLDISDLSKLPKTLVSLVKKRIIP